MERQKILNPLTGRMVYADGVVAKSIPKMKKSVGVLEGAIKRTLAKKPETKPETKPEPKKLYGWEDLPDDIKAKISGIVKENVVLQNEKKMRDFLKEVKEYYKREMPDIKPLPAFFKEQNEEFNKLKLSKMDKYELRDFIYKGEMDRMIKRVVWNRLWLYLEQFSIRDYGDIFLRKGTFFMKYTIQTDKEDYIYSLLEYDYRDNYKFFNYVKNHPVNEEGINGEKYAYIQIFRGDEMEERSNNPEYEYFTFVEMIYNKGFRDKNGFLLKQFTPSPTIPIKVFYVKISKTSTFYKKYERTKQNKSWISILQDIKPNGFEYSEGELKYTNTDELPSYFTWYIDANNKIRMYIKQKPNFKKP